MTMADELAVMPYPKYLRTKHWKAVFQAVYERDGGRCVLCNREGNTGHHRSYDHRGDFEREVHDVHLLCQRCHQQVHHLLPGGQPSPTQLQLSDLVLCPDGSYRQKQDRG